MQLQKLNLVIQNLETLKSGYLAILRPKYMSQKLVLGQVVMGCYGSTMDNLPTDLISWETDPTTRRRFSPRRTVVACAFKGTSKQTFQNSFYLLLSVSK